MQLCTCSAVSDSLRPHGACQAPISLGFFRQEYWSGLPFHSPGDLPDPGIEPGSPALQAGSLLCKPRGKPRIRGIRAKFSNQEREEYFKDRNTTLMPGIFK